MKQIYLPGGYIATVDDEDYTFLSQYGWCLNNNKAKNKYAVAFIKNQKVEMHRLIMGCVKGDGKMIDHRDRNSLNNQKSNLRLCTNSENQKNKQAAGTSKYLGVCWHTVKNRYYRKKTNELVITSYSAWRATIKVGGRYENLGRFKEEADAALAYNEAAKKYHGEFANLNEV